MHNIYLLRSVQFKKIYIRLTDDVPTRLLQHNRGETISTRRFRLWKCVYYEVYISLRDAQIRERRLKYYGKALGQLKRRLVNSLS